jgi:hypothetical protein
MLVSIDIYNRSFGVVWIASSPYWDVDWLLEDILT